MTQNILTTSVGLLAPAASYRPVFSPVPLSSDDAFDEGPIELRWKPDVGVSVSGSLNNLSSSYPFVQGVEITKHAQYARGVFKIWSGDPQHRLRRSTFGQERTFAGNAFVETDRFSALSLVRDDVRSFTSDDDNPIEGYSYNGIIEPLSIRNAVFRSTLANEEPHSVKGTLMGGTINQDGGAAGVVSVDVFSQPVVISGFIDGTMARSLTRPTATELSPFIDERLIRTIPLDGSEQPDMVAALSEMTGSTDGYVRHDQRSAPCGWYYDNTHVGTDSLTFGGMTY